MAIQSPGQSVLRTEDGSEKKKKEKGKRKRKKENRGENRANNTVVFFVASHGV